MTLKAVEGLTFEMANAAMRNVIGKEALRFEYLMDSKKLSDREKELYTRLVRVSNGMMDTTSATHPSTAHGM